MDEEPRVRRRRRVEANLGADVWRCTDAVVVVGQVRNRIFRRRRPPTPDGNRLIDAFEEYDVEPGDAVDVRFREDVVDRAHQRRTPPFAVEIQRRDARRRHDGDEPGVGDVYARRARAAIDKRRETLGDGVAQPIVESVVDDEIDLVADVGSCVASPAQSAAVEEGEIRQRRCRHRRVAGLDCFSRRRCCTIVGRRWTTTERVG